MRVPLDWLREYCDPDLDVNGVGERLTMTGTKVEAIHHHGVAEFDRFVVGRVLEVGPHPEADRLRICTVDLGEANGGRPARIVCGAPNVAAGQTVAVALVGAVMPDGSVVEHRELRGVLSEGMICSEQELAVGPDGEGILTLDELAIDAEPAPGAPLAELLEIATEVIELEVTPNRPDCLGIYAVARELHAASGAPLAPVPWREDPGSLQPSPGVGVGGGPLGGAKVEVLCPDLCPRFTARVFEQVALGPSPLWLKARLSAAGQRPINNVVDITNYAMLLTAQPLHAFDLDRVSGARLTVRTAHAGEPVTTLDGQTRTLSPDMVVIEDADGPTSIAGLMGGERSEVAAETTRVLLEVANWDGPNIHRTSLALGLRSEASSRFEKGLAPEQCLWAQAVATRLLLEVCCARVLPGTIDVAVPRQPPSAIRLRHRRLGAVLGIEIERARQAEILAALDFQVADAPDGLDATPPPARRLDVTREADLIEEVARIDGVDRLPATLPKRRGAYGLLTREQRLHRRAVDALVGRGLYEAIGWSFASPQTAERLRLEGADPRRRAPVIENPLSLEQSLLRTTVLGSLLETAAHNIARGMSDLRLFEVGSVFEAAGQPAADGPSRVKDPLRETGVAERRSLGVLLSGRLHGSGWRIPDPPVADFFAAKGVLEALASSLRLDRLEADAIRGAGGADQEPFLHPGRAASVRIADGEPIGWLGELHPLVAEAWTLPGAACFELDLDRLIAGAPTVSPYEDLIGYPPLRQDLAIALPQEVSAAQAQAAVRRAAGVLLRDVRVFDLYTGPQVGRGKRSLALALSFRAADRTLRDDDIAPLRERILAALAELGGELRG
jgi:phenylalanyl-tRNA synthetase beta chain